MTQTELFTGTLKPSAKARLLQKAMVMTAVVRKSKKIPKWKIFT